MQRRLFCTLAAGLALACTLAATLRGVETPVAGNPAGLTIHEWGTFTSLQDESGQAIGGINTDDEPVPDFVHDVARLLLLSPTEVPPIFFQGAPSCHPDVTMRLETPVLYFHAPRDFQGAADVSVAFNGGWLTQFYPQAAATTPGIKTDGWGFGHLTGQTVGRLDWRGLKVNAAGEGPQTTAHVWLAPRAVQASVVQTQEGEREKFLFYRGVGHLDAPLRVVRSADGRKLDVLAGNTLSTGLLPIGKLWLVDIRPDGTAAYSTLGPVTPAGRSDAPLVTAAAEFANGAYDTKTVDRLRAELRSALVAQGLNADEADALLNTWELSYFKSPGLRLFFLVPQTWTDRVLPLTVAGVPAVTRVMVGRIELVTPRQRALLADIAAGPPADAQTLFQSFDGLRSRPENRVAWNEVFAGTKSLAQAGVKVPASYQSYLDLGRFRNALILDEERRGGNAKISRFIQACHLEGYKVPIWAEILGHLGGESSLP